MSTRNSIEIRLVHWAIWEVSFMKNQQGWPKDSALSKFCEEGFIPNENSNRTSSLPYRSHDAEVVRAKLNILQRENPEQARALFWYYLTQRSIRNLAKEQKISKTKYYTLLKQAKKRMEEMLDDDEAKNKSHKRLQS